MSSSATTSDEPSDAGYRLMITNIRLIEESNTTLTVLLNALNTSREDLQLNTTDVINQTVLNFEESFKRSPLSPYKEDIIEALFNKNMVLLSGKFAKNIELELTNNKALAKKPTYEEYSKTVFKKSRKSSVKKKPKTEIAAKSKKKNKLKDIVSKPEKKKKSKNKEIIVKADTQSKEKEFINKSEKIEKNKDKEVFIKSDTQSKDKDLIVKSEKREPIIPISTKSEKRDIPKVEIKKEKVEKKAKSKISFKNKFQLKNKSEEENTGFSTRESILASKNSYAEKANCPDITLDTLVIISKSKKWLVVEYTISNKGVSAANLFGKSGNDDDNLALKAYVSSSKKLSRGSLPVGGDFVKNGIEDGMLHPNESYTNKMKLDIRKVTKFTPFLIINIDPFNAINECDKTNNKKHVFLK